MESAAPAPDPADVESIDAIVTAAYDGISGPAGKKRDWNRERSLYFPGARLIPTAMKPGGENVDLAPQILDIDGFIARVEPFFEENGFYEKEIARRTEQFGNIAYVWSTWECPSNRSGCTTSIPVQNCPPNLRRGWRRRPRSGSERGSG